MKAPLTWLADYVDLPDSLDALIEKLILSGTEVEDVIRPSENWNDVVIAQVMSLERPPESKHLSVAELNVGSETIIAVTGAPNIEVGQRVPIVRLGGLVPCGPDGQPAILQPRKMLGITGEAMVLSERELGLSDEHAGIMVLADDAPVGQPLSTITGDTVLDVEAKGRPDELCLMGVAREIAAISRVPLQQPDTRPPGNDMGKSVRITRSPSAVVTVSDADLCPRFTALRIDGITIAPSPAWLTQRLESAGVRSINNVVDVTNFVMLEFGQPLHAYDHASIPNAEIIVRRAASGESIRTLDGVERTLIPGTLLIADTSGPTGIAGIMGGGTSEVTSSTISILLEAANFDRVSIRRSSRRLGLRTEASARFERGVPPELTSIAIARCLNLFASIMPQELTVYDLVDVSGNIPTMPTISFQTRDMERLLGVDVPLESAIDSLGRLGFETSVNGDVVTAVPPYWRRDVEATADIAEEIARMMGYDTIPESLPGQQTAPVPLPPDLHCEVKIRSLLWGIGLSEAWTDTLTSYESLARLFPPTASGDLDWSAVVVNPNALSTHQASAAPMRLINAPSNERSVLRSSLVPSLLDVVSQNLKHTRERVAFFELARTFFPRAGDLPYERRTLAIAIAGERDPRGWTRTTSVFDFFDLKGMVEAVLNRLNISGSIVPPLEGAAHPSLHPGRQARMMMGDQAAGYMGELHPVVGARFEVASPIRAYVAELDLDVLIANAGEAGAVRPISRFPAVKRDISLTFPSSVQAITIDRVLREAGSELLREVRVVDVYEDPALGHNRKSISLGLEFQSDSGTLTQEQVAAVQNEIVSRLEGELGAQLRA